MSKMVDPPEGWRYGFPKVCDKEFSTAEEFNDWLVENGYPRKVIESYGKWFACRWWEEDEESNQKSE